MSQDLHVTLAARDRLDEVRAALAELHAAALAQWPGAEWNYLHGPATVPRVVAAVEQRVAAHVPDPEGGDGRFYGPFGSLIARAAGRTLVFRVELRGAASGTWQLVVEPRLRRKLLGFISSDRIPGSRELDSPTASALRAVLMRVAELHGARARLAPGDPHWQRTAVLVFP